jgi:hypothetical protein
LIICHEFYRSTGPFWIRQGVGRDLTASRGAVPRKNKQKTINAETKTVNNVARGNFGAKKVAVAA